MSERPITKGESLARGLKDLKYALRSALDLPEQTMRAQIKERRRVPFGQQNNPNPQQMYQPPPNQQQMMRPFVGVRERLQNIPFFQRFFPQQQSQNPPPSQDSPPEQIPQDENTVEYWEQRISDYRKEEPVRGTPAYYEWDRKMQYFRNRITQITGVPLLRGDASVARPDSGHKEPKKGSDASVKM